MKRVYHMLSLLALINLFAIGGLVAYLFGSGKLNTERVQQVVKVMNGEWPTTQPVASQPTTVPAEPRRSETEIARVQAQQEFYELIGERHKREMQDRRGLNEMMQLDVTRIMEQIEVQKRQFAEQRAEFEKKTEQAGFEGALQVYSAAEPRLAKDLLMKRKDADVVQLLMKMDPNRRKKVVNACKTQAEQEWIGRILVQITNSNAPAGGVDGPLANTR